LFEGAFQLGLVLVLNFLLQLSNRFFLGGDGQLNGVQGTPEAIAFQIGLLKVLPGANPFGAGGSRVSSVGFIVPLPGSFQRMKYLLLLMLLLLR
jgi:hypothetical protein